MTEKRYNLALSEELYEQLKDEADSRHITMLDLIKRFLRLGFLVMEVEKNGGKFIIRDSAGNDQQVLFM